MVMFVNGKRVITNAPGAIVRSVSKNYTTTWHQGTADFENICKSEELKNCCEDVRVDGYAVATIDSFFPQSHGDEAGIGGGVKSGTINGKGVFKTASPDVFVSSLDGSILKSAIIREGDLVVSNAGNCEPAPIEYLPAYQINNPCETPKVATKKEETDYRLSVVVHGRNQHFYGHFVNHCHVNKTHNQAVLATSEAPNDVEGLAKRLYLNNVRHDYYSYGFYQNGQDGKRIAISFLDELHQDFSENKKTPVLPFLEEPMQVVLLRLVAAHQLPKKQLINVANEDFSDLLRLSDGLRARVYQNLMLHQLTLEAALFDDETKEGVAVDDVDWAKDFDSMLCLKAFDKNWYEIMPAELQECIDDELSTKVISSLGDGFLYVYLNGHIWREIALKKGALHEVDLRVTGGTDHRPATGIAQDDLMLPYKIAGQAVSVEMAYSTDQWSWGRIRYYGGMAQKDERRIDKIDPIIEDLAASEKNRSKRFITLDLSALISDKKKEVKNSNDMVQLFEEFGIYHLVIPDPLLPIHRAMSDIFHLNNELQSVMEKINHPLHCAHGSSAALAYKYFFNPKEGLLAKQQSTKEIKLAEANRALSRAALISSHNWRKAAAKGLDENDDLRLKIDLDKIKATLKVDRRKRLRDLIRALQRSLVSLVQRTDLKALVDIKPALVSESPLEWERCLKDSFAGDLLPYAKAFTFIGTLSNVLMLEPSDHDVEMDLECDIDKSTPTPGSQFILALHEKSHPLYDLIHPNEAALEKAKTLPPVKQSEPFYKSFNDYKNTGEDAFNPHFFKYISANMLTTSQGLGDAFNAVVKDLVSNFKESLSRGAVDSEDLLSLTQRPYTLFIHYQIVIDNVLMPKTQLKLRSSMTENDVIIGMHSDYLQAPSGISEPVESMHQGALLAAKKPNNEISVKKNIEKVRYYSGENTVDFIQEAQVAEVFHKKTVTQAKVKNASYQNTKVSIIEHVVIVADKEDYKKTFLFKEKALQLLDVSSSSLLLVLSVWNVKSKLDAIKKYKKEEGHGSAEKKLELTDAMLSSSYMVENVVRSFTDLDYVEGWYKSQSETLKRGIKAGFKRGFAFTPLSFLATLGSILNIALSLKSLYGDLSKHSPQLLVPHLAKLGINMGTTLSFVGTAAERAIEKELKKKLAEYATKEAFEHLSSFALKQLAVKEILDQGAFGVARKVLIRLSIPFANTYVGLFLLLSGFLLDFILSEFKDSALLSWLKSTPFILPAYAIEPLNESMLLADFASIMTHPTAIIAKADAKGLDEKNCYFIEITLPFFDVANNQLQVCLYYQNITIKQGIRTFGVLPESNTKVEYSTPHFIQTEEQEVYFNEAQQLTKVRYYLTPEQFWPHFRGDNVKLMCQFRVLLKDGTSLPLEKMNGAYLKKHTLNHTDDASAYHAEPLYAFVQGQSIKTKHAREHENINKDILEKSKKFVREDYPL